MVGETGLAPAWAFAREFLRLVCIRSTTRRKKFGAAGATCTLTRRTARRFLRPPGLLFHARPQSGRGGRSRTGTGNDAQRGLSPPCLRSNHAAKEIGADRGNRTLMGFRPSAPRADVSTVPPRPHKKWSIHRDVRPARCLTKTVRRYLRLGCMVEAEGLAPS